jgi:hypothetical protein
MRAAPFGASGRNQTTFSSPRPGLVEFAHSGPQSMRGAQMGDKGGKKDKEKQKQQQVTKRKQDEQKKQDRTPRAQALPATDRVDRSSWRIEA